MVKVRNSIPSCNQDPISREAQIREVLVNILSGTSENTPGRVLLIWDDAIHTDVNVDPEGSDDVFTSIDGKVVKNKLWWRLIECKVSVTVNLDDKKIY